MIIMSKKNVGKVLAGAAVGVGLGMLFAPKKGSDLRKDLKNKIDEFISKIKDVDANEVKDEFFKKADEIKKELENLDKEQVLKIAKDKSELLKKKADELLNLAKKKGTPGLEGIANDIKDKTIEVAKDVIEKLEKSKK